MIDGCFGIHLNPRRKRKIAKKDSDEGFRCLSFLTVVTAIAGIDFEVKCLSDQLTLPVNRP